MAAEVNRLDPMGLNPFDIEKMDKLTKMLTRETSAISQLATKMRIAQQSTVTAVQNKKRIGKKPWEAE